VVPTTEFCGVHHRILWCPTQNFVVPNTEFCGAHHPPQNSVLTDLQLSTDNMTYV
jgi:hypothetical protein